MYFSKDIQIHFTLPYKLYMIIKNKNFKSPTKINENYNLKTNYFNK